MNQQLIPFILKTAFVVAILLVGVWIVIMVEKRQREQLERENRGGDDERQ